MISPKPVFWLKEMNTQRNEARRVEEIANVRAPPRGDQVPLLEEVVVDDQDPSNPPPMTETEMRAILDQMAQAITTQAQAVTVQAQAMTSQANRGLQIWFIKKLLLWLPDLGTSLG